MRKQAVLVSPPRPRLPILLVTLFPCRSFFFFFFHTLYAAQELTEEAWI